MLEDHTHKLHVLYGQSLDGALVAIGKLFRVHLRVLTGTKA